MRKKFFNIAIVVILCGLLLQGCAAVAIGLYDQSNSIGTEEDVKKAIEEKYQEKEIVITAMEWNIIAYTKASFKRKGGSAITITCIDTGLFHPIKVLDCKGNQ